MYASLSLLFTEGAEIPDFQITKVRQDESSSKYWNDGGIKNAENIV